MTNHTRHFISHQTQKRSLKSLCIDHRRVIVLFIPHTQHNTAKELAGACLLAFVQGLCFISVASFTTYLDQTNSEFPFDLFSLLNDSLF